MYTFDFNACLKKLNKHLYVESGVASSERQGGRAVAVKRRVSVRKASLSVRQQGHISQEDRGFLEDEIQGTKDEFIMAIPYPFVPEYDEFDLPSGRLIKRGWRSAALSLVKKGICTMAEAKKAFRCSSLGESTYDKLPYEGKLRMIRESV